MASSWEYPSLNRMSDYQQSDRIGEFERLPSRINANQYNNSNNNRSSRFDAAKDTKGGGYGGGRGARNREGGHIEGVHGVGSHDFPQDPELLSNLPLPRPGLYGNRSSSNSWDLPSSSSSSKAAGGGAMSGDDAVGRRNGCSSSSSIESMTLDEEMIKEELFPPNKIALVQENLDACPDLDVIGLEYVIEVQHNSAKNLAPIYHCLLCHEKTKTCETTSASLELIKSHLQTVSHKVNYIEAYFPTLKKCVLNKVDGGFKSNAFREAVAGISTKIRATYGKMNIKIVVGLNLFGRRQQEIKKMIDNSTHFRENKEFLDLVLGGDQYLANSYEKAFSDFEAELRKKNSRDRHRSYEPSYRDRSYRSRERYRHRRSRSRSPRYSDDRKSSSRNSYDKESSEYDRNKRGGGGEKTDETSKKSAFVDILVNRKDHEVTQRRHSYNRQSSSSFKDKRIDYSSPESSSTPTRHLSKGQEKEIERYLAKDKILNEKLDQERKEYLNFPHTHRKYNEEWEKFYLDITTKRGISDSEIINQEWIEHWKAFFFESFDLEVRKRKEELMADHQVTNRDLDDYYHLKSKSLEEQVENKISNSRENSVISSKNDEEEEDDKEVTVISTFRLLFGLESILDELGPTVIRLMSKINSIEVNEGFGSSSNMINEDEVFTLLWKAKEKLDYKINNDIIDGSKLPASKVCVNNISCLIKKSKCEVPKEPPNPHLSNEISIRAGIAKTVVEQFNAQGKIITESQLASIVEMEYARVKDSVSASTSSSSSATTTTVPNPQSKSATIELMDFNKKPEKEEMVTPKSEGDLEKMTCKQLADIFKRFREFNKITRCMILDYMKKIEKTNPARVTEMKKIIHAKA